MSKRDERVDGDAFSFVDPGALDAAGYGSAKDLLSIREVERMLVNDDGSFQYGRFWLSKTGLTIPEDITADEWGQMGLVLLHLQGSLQWLLGDWLAFGETRQWGETYRQVAEEFGKEVETLWTYTFVARSVNYSIRIEELSFSHHRLVAGLKTPDGSPDVETQTYWLTQAKQNRWTLSQMREAMKDDPPALPEIVTGFQQEFRSFFRKFGKKYRGVGQSRQQIADLLRHMAEQVERGDLG